MHAPYERSVVYLVAHYSNISLGVSVSLFKYPKYQFAFHSVYWTLQGLPNEIHIAQ